jgi:glycine/D-amino acid oxidase-like deaminating enzyme
MAASALEILSDRLDELGVDVRHDTSVEQIDTAAKTVTTDGGETIGYDKIILSCGPWTNQLLKRAELSLLPTVVCDNAPPPPHTHTLSILAMTSLLYQDRLVTNPGKTPKNERRFRFSQVSCEQGEYFMPHEGRTVEGLGMDLEGGFPVTIFFHADHACVTMPPHCGCSSRLRGEDRLCSVLCCAVPCRHAVPLR